MPKGVIEGKNAREYDAYVLHNKRNKFYEEFILKNVKPKTRICDLCTGTGANIELLKKKAKEIVGVDLSKEMIKICSHKFKNNKNVKLKLASATNTKLNANYFDYVIIRMGLHHIKDKNAVVDEAHRILKPNGRFIVVDKYYMSLFELYSKIIYGLVFHFNTNRFNEYLVSKEKNHEVLLRQFKIIKKKYLPVKNGHIGQPFMYVLEKT